MAGFQYCGEIFTTEVTEEFHRETCRHTYRNHEAILCTFLAAAINISDSSDSKFPYQGPYIL